MTNGTSLTRIRIRMEWIHIGLAPWIRILICIATNANPQLFLKLIEDKVMFLFLSALN